VSEPLIQRYEHHGFTGWVVCTTRRNKRFRCYFSDHPNGGQIALQAARAYRGKLLSRLPPPRKTKITNKRNTTGVMGVCRQEVRRRSGRLFARYIAEWPKSDGTKGSASFSVNLYGEEDAFELAVYCRRKGLRELGLPRSYYVGLSLVAWAFLK
jgi:AP2 domain